MSKKKNKTPGKPRAKPAAATPGAPVPSEELIDQATLLLVTLRTHTEVLRALTEKLDLDPRAADDVLEAARQRLAIIAAYDKPEQLGLAITRLKDLYARSLAVQDAKTALGVQKEMNRLLGLGKPAAGEAAPNPHDAAAELAAVRGYLEPLRLGDADTPTAELARLAVAKLLTSKG